jgi:xanthine dehydrogenase YagR molybdenum-binding subunit
VLAASFGLAEEKVRVLTPFVGGGSGAGLRTWPHSILAALAACTVKRPVQLSLTRPEMFTGMGRRPSTVQHLKSAAKRDGNLVAIYHEATSTASMHNDSPYPITTDTTAAYACPNVTARDKRVRLNIPPIAHMRAPGQAEGNFALESMLDELSYQLGWTRSSCGRATTPRSIPRPDCRGPATPSVSATRWAPSASAGRSANRPWAPCATGTGWSATAWPG